MFPEPILLPSTKQAATEPSPVSTVLHGEGVQTSGRTKCPFPQLSLPRHKDRESRRWSNFFPATPVKNALTETEIRKKIMKKWGGRLILH